MIGIFDSGVGGLSVYREVAAHLPAEPVVYVADQAWAPYGERSLLEVRRRAFDIAAFLISCGARVVVVACNSASAAALHELRAEHPDVPFVGMEPAVKPAAEQTQSGAIGVLATDATFQGELFATVVDNHANGVHVVTQACPGLANLIESGITSGPIAAAAIEPFLDSLRQAKVDTVALGCTHYPFVMDTIAELLGPSVTIIDPAPAVARQVERVLPNTAVSATDTRFYTTGDPQTFAMSLEALIGVRATVEQLDVLTSPAGA